MRFGQIQMTWVVFWMGALCPGFAAEVTNYRIVDLPEQIIYENSARDLSAIVNPEISEFGLSSDGDETWISLAPANRSEDAEYIVGYLAAPLRFDVEILENDGRLRKKRIFIPAHTSTAIVEVYFEDSSPYDFMKQGKLRLEGAVPTMIDLD